MSTANRNARRETARQAAFSFLSNIALGSEVDNSNAQNGDNDYSDNFGDSNFKSALPSQASDHGSPVVADYPGNAGRSGSAGTTTLPRTRSWSRTSDMKIDTTKQGETFPNAKADHQSPRNRDDLSESPSEFRSKEPTSATVSGNSLSDGDLDDNSMSRSGQLSGSAILSGGDSTATSLLSKQLEQRPDVASSRRNKSDYFEYEDHHHHKLTREDNSKPIASEKIKKKHVEKEHTGLGILSAFRYYSDKIRQSAIKRRGENAPNKGYVSQQQIANHDSQRRRPAQSFAHFLDPCGSLQSDEDIEKELTPSAYDPYFLDNENLSADRIKAGGSSHGTNTQPRPAEVKRELNELFRSAHPEIPQEITLSKIRAIKEHMLEIGKELDLEISSVAHAYVYFEKLILKNIITKKNRKLIAGCCLFLATKVNEPKGSKLQPLLDAIDDELDIDAEEIWEHEFAVFADLEFNLYVPRREFMPHFERICSDLELRSIEAYLGDMDFFSVDIK